MNDWTTVKLYRNVDFHSFLILWKSRYWNYRLTWNSIINLFDRGVVFFPSSFVSFEYWLLFFFRMHANKINTILAPSICFDSPITTKKFLFYIFILFFWCWICVSLSSFFIDLLNLLFIRWPKSWFHTRPIGRCQAVNGVINRCLNICFGFLCVAFFPLVTL